jgi:hypothetical protein
MARARSAPRSTTSESDFCLALRAGAPLAERIPRAGRPWRARAAQRAAQPRNRIFAWRCALA